MDITAVFTPLPEAIEEIHRRRQDKALVAAVEDFLEHDIPPHFTGEQPILYLCRHIATPNMEAMRFVEITKPHGLPIVIGEDHRGKFVTNNILKKSLGKLPVMKGLARNQDEIIENFTVIDFSLYQGERFCDIATLFGTSLIDLHHRLFWEIYPAGIRIVNESDWIDRNNRDDLAEHYKRLFSLLIIHGIMFESYPPLEHKLFTSAVAPALKFVQEYFGYKPLIYELITDAEEEDKDWNAYPSVLYRCIQEHFRSKQPVR